MFSCLNNCYCSLSSVMVWVRVFSTETQAVVYLSGSLRPPPSSQSCICQSPMSLTWGEMFVLQPFLDGSNFNSSTSLHATCYLSVCCCPRKRSESSLVDSIEISTCGTTTTTTTTTNHKSQSLQVWCRIYFRKKKIFDFVTLMQTPELCNKFSWRTKFLHSQYLHF